MIHGRLLLRGLSRSFEEVIVFMVLFIANILPDLSILSFIRSIILMCIANIQFGTRIKKIFILADLEK